MPFLNAVTCLREISQNKLPWVIAGKGPSSTHALALDPDLHNILSLNHMLLHLRPRVAHFTDLKAYQDCKDRLHELFIGGSNTSICMPWHPHIDMKPTWCTLESLMGSKDKGIADVAKTYVKHRRFLSYNSSTAQGKVPHRKLPMIRVRYFSAVGAFNLLAEAGVKVIYTAGIDGGTEYAPIFNDEDRLANTRLSFDDQFKEIERTCRQYGITRKLVYPSTDQAHPVVG